MNLRYLLEIHSELHHPKGADPGNVEDLFAIWMRNVRREAFNEKNERVPSSFLKARQYVEKYFVEPVTLNEIAKTVGLSKSYLCKGFKHHFAMSPLDYAMRLRLQLAVELMEDVNLNISQIAERCGYADIYYFSRLFKKRFGASPRAYRKSLNQDGVSI